MSPKKRALNELGSTSVHGDKRRAFLNYLGKKYVGPARESEEDAQADLAKLRAASSVETLGAIVEGLHAFTGSGLPQPVQSVAVMGAAEAAKRPPLTFLSGKASMDPSRVNKRPAMVFPTIPEADQEAGNPQWTTTMNLTNANGMLILQKKKEWEGRPVNGLGMKRIKIQQCVRFRVGSHAMPWWLVCRVLEIRKYKSLGSMLADKSQSLLPCGPHGEKEAMTYYERFGPSYRQGGGFTAFRVEVVSASSCRSSWASDSGEDVE